MLSEVLVDAEALAIAHLLGEVDLQALIEDRVYPEVPPDPTWPLLTVVRVGGLPTVSGWLDLARLQIDSWAETKEAAWELGARAQAACYRMEGSHPLGVVTAVGDDLPFRWFPDPETDRPRYQFGIAVTTHP